MHSGWGFGTPRPLQFLRSRNSTSHPQVPNSHGIISFADPHLLNPFIPYRYKNHRGWGAAPNLRIPRRMRILSDHRESKGSSPGSRHFSPDFVFSLSLLVATLTRMPISVHSKGFTGMLSPLDATLTKNQGGLRPSTEESFLHTRYSAGSLFSRSYGNAFCNSFVFTLIPEWGGTPPPFPNDRRFSTRI